MGVKLVSPAWQADSLLSHLGSPRYYHTYFKYEDKTQLLSSFLRSQNQKVMEPGFKSNSD